MAPSHRPSYRPRRSGMAAAVVAARLIHGAALLALLLSGAAPLALAQPADDKNPCSTQRTPGPGTIAADNAAAPGGSTAPPSPSAADGTGAGGSARLRGTDIPSLIGDSRRLRLENRIVDGPVHLNDVDLDSLTIKNSVIYDGLCIANSTIDKRILIADTQFRKTRDDSRNALGLTQVKFGSFRLTNHAASEALEINLSQVTGGSAFIGDTDTASLRLFDDQFSEMLVLAGGTVDEIELWNISLGSLVLRPKASKKLKIEKLSSRSDVTLPIDEEISPRQSLELQTISCPTLQLASAQGGTAEPVFNADYRPQSIAILDIRCARIDAGQRPDKFIDFLQGGTGGTTFHHDQGFFGQLAKSYLETAHYPNARELYVRQKEVDADQESTIARGAMKTMGFVEFGTNLNMAVSIVALFVLAGWGLFSYGARLDRREREKLGQPDDGRSDPNWLWFSIDSAIPFLSLNDDHKKVSFGRWWCQYYLYGMKILSPIFVFFAFQFLRQLLPS